MGLSGPWPDSATVSSLVSASLQIKEALTAAGHVKPALEQISAAVSEYAAARAAAQSVLDGLTFTAPRIADRALLTLSSAPMLTPPRPVGPDLRPRVRELEWQVRELEKEVKAGSKELRRSRKERNADLAKMRALQSEVGALRAENHELQLKLMLRDMGDTQDDTDIYFPPTDN